LSGINCFEFCHLRQWPRKGKKNLEERTVKITPDIAIPEPELLRIHTNSGFEQDV
jgi:hypothetical protein